MSLGWQMQLEAVHSLLFVLHHTVCTIKPICLWQETTQSVSLSEVKQQGVGV